MRGRDGVWVALPQRKEGDGWVPVVEFPSEILERVRKAVLEAYREQLRQTGRDVGDVNESLQLAAMGEQK